MQDFIKHFEREPDGAWKCVTPAEITTILGRIQVAQGTRFMPGTIFMAVDIVQLLEQEAERQGLHRKPRVSEFPCSPQNNGRPAGPPASPAGHAATDISTAGGGRS